MDGHVDTQFSSICMLNFEDEKPVPSKVHTTKQIKAQFTSI